jgi:hypothetical protein
MIFLAAGLVLIVGLSILERVRERPSFDWSRTFRQAPIFPETDLQVEGLARSGDVSQAIAMFQRLHKVDQKKAQRAVSRGPGQDRTGSPAHAATIAAEHEARAVGRGNGCDTGGQERRGETEASPVDGGIGVGNHQ